MCNLGSRQVNREGYLISLRWLAQECHDQDTKTAATLPLTPTTNSTVYTMHAACMYVHVIWHGMAWQRGREGGRLVNPF